MSFENLSDAELMMIEQLTYFGDIGEAQEGCTIGEIISNLSLDNLKVSGQITQEEAIAICRYLKENEDTCNLVLQDVVKDGKSTISYCFTENVDNPVEAIVAFRGTTKAEWGDNFLGFIKSFTERQQDAREYIEGNYIEHEYIPGEYVEGKMVDGKTLPGEYVPGRYVNCEYVGGLPYDDITVIGHSKGGNKAMYTAITCEAVKRCVAMDSQGFSTEFFEEYGYEISQKASIIKNYSVKSDIVHPLMFQIPGSEQIYCEGYRIKEKMDCHKPSAYFQLDENGDILCENGAPVIATGATEDPAVIMLHEFTCYLLNVASDEDRESISNFIATIIDAIMINDCSSGEIAQFILNNPDELSLILAYLVKYMDTYELTYEDIDGLLEVIGLNSLDEYFCIEVETDDITPYLGLVGNLIPSDYELINFGLSDIISYLQNNLSDEEYDFFTSLVLNNIPIVGKDLNKFWNDTECKINSIPSVSKAEGRKEIQIKVTEERPDASIGEILVVDTNKLRQYANRLEKANKRLIEVDKRMDKLYLKVELREIIKLFYADLSIHENPRITKCVSYLNTTATEFELIERQVKNLF